MTIRTHSRKQTRKVPRLLPGEKPVYCANPECGKFLCYENVEIGFIRHRCHRCKEVTQFSRVPGDDTAPDNMREVRCGWCGRFLYLEAIVKGSVKTKCRGCGQWHRLEIIPEGAIINTKVEKPSKPTLGISKGE